MARRKDPPPEQGALFVAPEARPATTEELGAVTAHAEAIVRLLEAMPLCARIEALNHARSLLHEASPFKAEPVDLVLWLPNPCFEANDYNPNQVAPPEMVALAHSVRKYGFTSAIVGSWIEGWRPPPPSLPGDYRRGVRINDGFHRNVVGRTEGDIVARLYGHLPVAALKPGLALVDLMSATQLHNKARGTHRILGEGEMLRVMDEAGWSSAEIERGLVKGPEEQIRLRHVGGVAPQLANAQYDKAWNWAAGGSKKPK
jgi:hypothetical protein